MPAMSNDPQDAAENLDDETTGAEALTSDQVEVDYPPTHPQGVQFADADVTDESFAERSLQEEPEVSEADIDERDADL
jgi:hypothetical protein